MDREELDAVVNTFITVMEDSPVNKVLVNMTLLFKRDSIEIVKSEVLAINNEELKNGEVQKEETPKK